MAYTYFCTLRCLASTPTKKETNNTATQTSPTQRPAGKRKVVAFSTVEIHHHKLILGDHPSVSDGVPLTLDWSVESITEAMDLETHEQYRISCPLRRHRRENRNTWCMESSEREQLARSNGASDACLIQTRKELSIIQSSRKLSELDQPWGLWASTTTSCYPHRCSILLSL